MLLKLWKLKTALRLWGHPVGRALRWQISTFSPKCKKMAVFFFSFMGLDLNRVLFSFPGSPTPSAQCPVPVQPERFYMLSFWPYGHVKRERQAEGSVLGLVESILPFLPSHFNSIRQTFPERWRHTIHPDTPGPSHTSSACASGCVFVCLYGQFTELSSHAIHMKKMMGSAP